MNDLFDSLHSRAQEHGTAMSARLDPQAAARAAHGRIARGRRHRVQLQALAVVAALGLVGAGTWLSQPHHPEPAAELKSARIGQTDIVPDGFEGMGCWGVGTGAPAYVPWTEPGVTIASEDVLNLGLEVDATYYQWGMPGTEGDAEAFDPGKSLNADWTFGTGGDSAEGAFGAQFAVSWAGDAHYTVDAVAFLVADGRVVSDFYGFQTPIVGDVPATDGRGYNADTHTTTRYQTVTINTANCLRTTDETNPQALVPPADAVMHTLVQVKDEHGVPLATYVDANGLDGLTVTYPQAVAAGHGASIDLVTDDEVTAIRAERERIAPVPSATLDLVTALDTSGQPLSSVGSGLSGVPLCGVEMAKPLDQPVIPVAVDIPDLPASFSRDDFQPVLTDDGLAQDVLADGNQPVPTEATLYFVDSDGDAAGWAYGTYVNDSGSTTWELRDWFGCTQTDTLEPGTYRAIAASTDPAALIEQSDWTTYWDVSHANPAVWMDLGDVRID
ncbi:hypothetical protein ON058_00150 [Demequina sp. B12]|uniref:hypothetical protein n=1 Tax=Demequina sp. B12 TaxID=2992757 RepID=UPI00237BBBD2|nr:hypothetical protein [Demequina sp. B12]MDE0571825.1 hypothetical protein [Demequina sp. B12]